MKHTMIINITPQGKVNGEVKGVKGKECGPLSKWLDELGKVEKDSPTPDFYQTTNQTQNTGG